MSQGSHTPSGAAANRNSDGKTIGRRDLLRAAGVGGIAATAGCTGIVGNITGGKSTINILTWEEYADPDIQSAIEEELDVKLEVTKTTSSAQMFSSWNAGQYKQYDIGIPNNNYVVKLMDADLIAPVQKDVVSHYDEMYDIFQRFAGNQFTANGDLYGVPIRFGWYGYSYDSREIPDHEESYDVLFEDQFEDVDLTGNVIMYNNHFKAMSATALKLGYRDAFEGSKVTLSQDQIDQIKQTMIDQKPLLQGYIAPDPTYIKSFKQGNFLIGQSGRNEIVAMWANGNDWPKMATPKEGSLAWFESAVVSEASDHKKTAWQVINEYIAPKNGATLAQVGFSPSVNPKTQQYLTEEQNDMYGAIDPSRLEGMIPFKAVENEQSWIKAWEEIKAA